METQAELHPARWMARLCGLVLCLASLTLATSANAPASARHALAAPPTFYSIADATTASAQPDTPFGGQSTLVVGRGATAGVADSYAYLQFDLSTIPGSAVVSSAQLVLYLAQSTAQMPPALRVHAVEQAWVEGQITWSNRPKPGTEVISQTLTLPLGDKSWDVTALVQSWVSGKQANHGLVIVPASTEPFQWTFNSREAQVNTPRLVVDYTLPTATATPTTGACPDNYEPNDGFDLAPFLLANTQYFAAICNPQDLDYYGITAGAGQHIRAELFTLPADYDLELYGPARDLLGRSENAGTAAEAVEHDALTGGSYYIRVYGKNGAFHAGSMYFFKVTLSGATWTPAATASPTAIASATPTLTPSPSATPPATKTPLPTATLTPTLPPPTVTPGPTETVPSPTGTPLPTPTSPPEERPDLTITDVWSDGTLLCYQVYNAGPGTAPAGHQTRLQVDNADQAMDLINGTLKPGERLTRCFNYSWTCSLPQDTVRVCADATQAVNESDEANNCREEAWKCDTTAPRIVGGPRVSDVTTTSARICWETDEASNSLVRYGWRAGQYTVTVSNGGLVTAHCVTLSGLSPASTYGLIAESTDAQANRVQSKPLLLTTLAAPELVSPQVWLHVPEVLSGTVALSADALDDTGVDRVVFTLDGVPVHTDSSPPYEWACDTRDLPDASHIFGARAFDLAGNGSTAAETRDVRNRFPVDLSPVRVAITYPPSHSTIYGDVAVEIEVNHDLWSPIQEVQIWAGGQLLLDRSYHCFFVLGERRCTGDPPLHETALWDASAYPVGSSLVITATASDSLGNSGTAGILVTVERPLPSIRAWRTVTREGNRFAVQLSIANNGMWPINNLLIEDQSSAFQAESRARMGTGTSLTDYRAGVAYSIADRASTIECAYPHTLAPGAILRIQYKTIPILFPPDETPPSPAIGHRLVITYTESASSYTERPATRWTGSEEWRLALAEADYLLVTQPDALFTHYVRDDVDDLLATMAELASEKNGALGYASPGVTNSRLKRWIRPGGAWTSQLGAAFSSPSTADAYLLLVGETEILPSFSYGDVHLSDHYYADITFSDARPELIAGRIIGDSAAALILPLRASLDVHYGTGFDRHHALSAGGYEDGPRDVFVTMAEEVAEDLRDQGVETDLLHWSTWIENAWTVRATNNDGFVLGNMDADPADEVLIACDEEQELYLYEASPRTLIRHVPIRFSAHDGLATGDLDADGRDEIVTAEIGANRINVYRYDGSLIASTPAPFAEWSGLALGDVLGDGWAGGVWIEDRNRDEILCTVRDSNRVYIYRLDGTGQLRESPSIVLDVSFSRYDGLAAGDVRVRQSGDDARWEKDEIILVRQSGDEIRIYDGDGTRLALLADINGDGSNDIHFTRYDGLTIGDVDERRDPNHDGEEEILVVSEDDDWIYYYYFEPHWEGEGAERRWVEWRTYRMYSRFFNGWFRGARLTGSDTRHDGVALGRIDPADERKLAILYNDNGDASSFQVLVASWDDADERANERVSWYSANTSLVIVQGHGNPWGASPLGYPRDTSWGTFDRHPLFLALSCLTGNYDDPGAGDASFGEAAFQHGAAASIGATEVSWGGDCDDTGRRYFEYWDVDLLGAGKAWKEYERDFARVFFSREYNFYGDCKFGAPGADGTAAVEMRAEAGAAAPPTTLDITVPAYTVEQAQGLDYVEIPGGGILPEDYRPRVPLYVHSVDVPAGYQVSGVTLLERGGPATAGGLLLPTIIPVTVSLPSSLQPPRTQAVYDDWYPSSDFTWTVIAHEDGGSELAVTLHPFFYNAQTLEARFYSQYRFQVTYTPSSVRVKQLTTAHDLYLPGQTVQIELDLENTGAAQDVVVEIRLRRYDAEEPVDGLPLRTLPELAGTASFAAAWDSTGFAPGEYEVEAVLRGEAGEVLDTGRAYLRLGLAAAEVTGLTALPLRFRPGDAVAIATTVRNAGTLALSGTVVVEVRDAGDAVRRTCYEPITGLAPDATQSLSCTWDSTGAAAGQYAVVSYVLYESSTSPARRVTLTAQAEERLFLPLVLR